MTMTPLFSPFSLLLLSFHHHYSGSALYSEVEVLLRCVVARSILDFSQSHSDVDISQSLSKLHFWRMKEELHLDKDEEDDDQPTTMEKVEQNETHVGEKLDEEMGNHVLKDATLIV
ncbi:hypothetical protein VNO78_10424 [Psophocarpus tetragonolobus]|uniref:Uncharacterized protein n=1 Tax=Psophocarpus tetragonolobus TaxID=3891 RepID=A0AAN9SJS0_PSOTE